MEQVPPVAADGAARSAAAAPQRAARASSTRPTATATTRRGRCAGDSTRAARVGNAARDAYVRELDGTLLPRVAARIEERLVEFAPQPEKLYEYLKAYLMLGEPRHLDKKHLQFVADLEWHAADNADPDCRGVAVEALPEPAGVQRHACVRSR